MKHGDTEDTESEGEVVLVGVSSLFLVERTQQKGFVFGCSESTDTD